MKVSIVVPVYNVPLPLLTECLAAVGRQTLRPDDYEILLVDDASTDAAVRHALDQFADAHENCRVLRHEANRGLNQARLTGLRRSRGEFVLFVDGDDILTRDAAELLYIESVRANADIVSAPFYRWNPATLSYYVHGGLLKPYPAALSERMAAALSGAHSFTMCSRLFRRALLREEHFDLPDALPHEDLATTIRLLFNAYRVAAIAEPILYYTINHTSITRVFTNGHVDGLFYALNDWFLQATERGMAVELERPMQVGAERMIDTVVLRCARSTNLTLESKLAVLIEIDRRYDSLPFPRPEPSLAGTKLLESMGSSGQQNAAGLQRLLDELIPPEPSESSSRYRRTLGPSDMAVRLKGKVVIVCQVDYQVRSAARLARALRQRGHPCVVMDNSSVADQGRRQLGPEDKGLFWRTEHIKVRDARYGPDWLSTASLVVAFNDFNFMFREALEYRDRLGLPTACMVEGINDFLRIDFQTPRALSYRRCDYVFLAGEDDAQYFEDRSTFTVGLPVVEALASTEPEFPREMHAVLNVNFTYGALEERRDEFVRAAQEAFDKLGITWEITQHPMDKGDLTGLPVSESTQQQLIDRCSVFVSRFATGILEALTSGKPVIYFNPHGERVAKFSEPLGAFQIARSSMELADGLRRVEADIAAGVDFRARAAGFLRRHAGFRVPDGSDVGSRFASAVTEVLDANVSKLAAASTLLVDRLEELEPFRQRHPGLVLGDFSRSHGAQLNEEEMIGRCFGPSDGLMLDVGANFGNSLDVFLGKGWTVHAFEPDPNNRAQLELLWPGCERLVINAEAVSNQDGMVVPLYASDESTGISSLSAFTEGHRQVAEVSTITLDTYTESASIEHVNFLKVDVEGFDKFVLEGFPWQKDRPDSVLVEFEDAKTVPLGYNVGDLAELLQRHDYTVYVSEWHPIVRYGIAHDWKRLSRYDPSVDLSGTWGNLVAFRIDPGEEALARAAVQTLRFVVRAPRPSTQPTHPAVDASPSPVPARAGRRNRVGSRRMAPRMRTMLGRWRRAWADRANHPRRWLRREFASGLRHGMPTLFRVAQAIAWMARAARRHRVATTSLAVGFGVAALLPVLADEPDWRPWCWSIAAILLVVAGGLAFGAAVRELMRRLIRRQDRAIARSHRALTEQIARLRSEVTAVREDGVRAVARSARQLKVSLHEGVSTQMARYSGELGHEVGLLRAAVESVRGQSTEAATKSAEQISTMLKAEAAERRLSNYSNVSGFTAHARYFSAGDAAHVQDYWQPKFGLSMPTNQLMYLAHDVCRIEDRCQGRLATSVQAAVVRSLALMSLGSTNLELLEIGTLFGIGAGALYRTGTREGRRVRLTLLDPLNGYHGVGFRDSATGVPVTLDVVERNLKEMAVAEPDVRVIVGKRGDAGVIAEVSDRDYDYVLIDGDKTLANVASDFSRYGRLVRPGGLLIFDYDTTEWSHNQTFIDGHVLDSGEWECVGLGWRTVVLARTPSPVGASPLGTSSDSSTVTHGG